MQPVPPRQLNCNAKGNVSQAQKAAHSLPQRLESACSVAADATACKHRAVTWSAPGNNRRVTGGSPQRCAGHDVVVITLQKVQQAGVRCAAGCLHGQWPLQTSASVCTQHVRRADRDPSECTGHHTQPQRTCSAGACSSRAAGRQATLSIAPLPPPSGDAGNAWQHGGTSTCESADKPEAR